MSTAISTKEWLRPSMLPKLALCRHYRSEAVAGEAAERGTRLDELFRAHFQGKPIPWGDLVADDAEALRWAIATMEALAGGLPVETNEEALRVEAMGLSGTADASCVEANWSADLKTGQFRNYLEQQALYAVGFMDANFVEEWTIYLPFCDQREVVTLRFTRDEAEKIVRDVLAKVGGDEPPTANDYCGWCAQRWSCPARREAIGILPIGGPGAVALEEMPSIALRDFALRAKVVEDFAKKARAILSGRIAAGEKVSGCTLVHNNGSREVSWRWIEANWKAIGTQALGSVIGNVSEAKLLPIIADKMPGAVVPPNEIVNTAGFTQLRVGQPKAEKA